MTFDPVKHTGRDEKWHYDAMLRQGYTLNNEPLPTFKFYCMAPDVIGRGTIKESSTVILDGKRIARLSYEFEPDGNWYKISKTITDILPEPEEILPGEIWLLPNVE